VRELSERIVGEIEKEIEQGKIPDNWDGIELRWLLSLKFHEAQAMTYSYYKSARKRDFNNTVIVNNL
jgi:hypothetical protein